MILQKIEVFEQTFTMFLLTFEIFVEAFAAFM